MKVVIIGATGLIGRKLATKLQSDGHHEFIQSFLSSRGDERKVIPDPDAKYFGAVLDKEGLVPSGQFIVGPTRFADWARSQC
jgi:uncharacterized protein YbjT (DUF2867 family)